jgi:hypothetical protein
LIRRADLNQMIRRADILGENPEKFFHAPALISKIFDLKFAKSVFQKLKKYQKNSFSLLSVTLHFVTA